MTKETTIYKVTCIPTGKAYIGITSSTLRRRWNDHVSGANRADPSKERIPIFRRAIRKYGKGQFIVEALFVVPTRSEAQEAEKRMIALHGTLNPQGYNLTEGGEGTPGYSKPHSAETRRKIGEAHKARAFSEETRLLMSVAKKGKKQKPEHIAKGAATRRGKRLTKEWRDNIATGHRGNKYPRRSVALLQMARAGGHPSSTGYRGVTQESATRWTARIGISGRRVHLGMFKSPEEASAAYEAAVAARIDALKTAAEPAPSYARPPIFLEALAPPKRRRALKPLPLFEYAEVA